MVPSCDTPSRARAQHPELVAALCDQPASVPPTGAPHDDCADDSDGMPLEEPPLAIKRKQREPSAEDDCAAAQRQAERRKRFRATPQLKCDLQAISAQRSDLLRRQAKALANVS